MYRVKDINNDIIFDWLENESKENDGFKFKTLLAEEYQKLDVSKNELKEIMDFYKGKFISNTILNANSLLSTG